MKELTIFSENVEELQKLLNQHTIASTFDLKVNTAKREKSRTKSIPKSDHMKILFKDKRVSKIKKPNEVIKPIVDSEIRDKVSDSNYNPLNRKSKISNFIGMSDVDFEEKRKGRFEEDKSSEMYKGYNNPNRISRMSETPSYTTTQTFKSPFRNIFKK